MLPELNAEFFKSHEVDDLAGLQSSAQAQLVGGGTRAFQFYVDRRQHVPRLPSGRQAIFAEGKGLLPGLGAGVARLLATTAMESFARSEALVVETARLRLARTLVSLAGEHSPGGGGVRQIDGITQEDLARMVGVSRTWVVLSLKLLEEQGLIRRHRRRIELADVTAMLSFVQAASRRPTQP